MEYIDNYALRSHRKRSGLTQEDVAALIGAQSPSQVSRQENGEREPDLRAALAYRIIFDTPIRHIVPKLYRDIAQQVHTRAEALATCLSRGFGYVIFAAPACLVDWGVKETRRDKNRQTKSKVEAMIQEMRPDAVVIENWFHESCRRCKRVRELLFEIAVVAHKGGATAMVYSRRHIREAFGELGKTICKAILI